MRICATRRGAPRYPPAMRAVLFDFDGVILDSEGVHEVATRAALAAVGGPQPREDWKRYMGLGDRDTFRRAYEDAGLTLDDPALLERLKTMKMEDVARRFASGEAPAYEGSVELVREACGAMGCVVCSGSRRREVEPALRGLGVLGLLRGTVTADECARLKPDPLPYVQSAATLGVETRDCVVIEDTPVGVRAGVGAGCVVIGVEHTNSAEALRGAGAHEVVRAIGSLSVDRLREVWARERG